MSVNPSKSASFTPREEVGSGVIVGVGVRVAGMLVDVGLNSGVVLGAIVVGDGGALQAATSRMPHRSNDDNTRRVKSIDVLLPSAVILSKIPCF